MNVSVQFSKGIEQALIARANAAGKDVATIVEELVTQTISEDAEPPVPKEPSRIVERLRAFALLHLQIDRPLDVSRESFYEGRGG